METRKHRAGCAVITVTEVLQLSGISDFSGIPEYMLNHARERGEVVHAACEALDRGQDVSGDCSKYLGYIAAYRQFKIDYNFSPTLIEYEIGESNWCGRCDRVGEIQGKEWVLDLKSSYEPSLSWRVQTAAYAIGLWGEKYRKARKKRAVVHLHKDASYDLLVYEDPIDTLLWKVALDFSCFKKGTVQ
jgi:hypothetical protein